MMLIFPSLCAAIQPSVCDYSPGYRLTRCEEKTPSGKLTYTLKKLTNKITLSSGLLDKDSGHSLQKDP